MCQFSPITMPVSSGSRTKRTMSSKPSMGVDRIAAERPEAPRDLVQRLRRQLLTAHGEHVIVVEDAAHLLEDVVVRVPASSTPRTSAPSAPVRGMTSNRWKRWSRNMIVSPAELATAASRTKTTMRQRLTR